MKKEIVIVGIVLLVAGAVVSIIPFQEAYQVQEPYTYTETKADLYTQLAIEPQHSWTRPILAADDQIGFWLDLDLTTTSAIQIKIYGDNSPCIFDVSGTRFTQKVYLTDADKWHIDMINNDWFTTSTVSGDIWVRHTVTGYNEVTEYRTVFPLMTYGIFTSIVGVAVIAVGLVVKSTIPKITKE